MIFKKTCLGKIGTVCISLNKNVSFISLSPLAEVPGYLALKSISFNRKILYSSLRSL